MGKSFEKDNFFYNAELETYICPLGEILYRRNIQIQKQTITYWTKECKKLHYERILLQQKELQNNSRL